MIIGDCSEKMMRKEKKQLNGSKKLIQILLLTNYKDEKINSNTTRTKSSKMTNK
jgi:hypothetical protein